MAGNENMRHLVAFEIGSSKIRGAVGMVDNSGYVHVMAVEDEPLRDKVRHGCVQNLEVTNVLDSVITRLQAYPCVKPRRITGAYVALGGRSVMSRQVDVALDLDGETEITQEIINELKQKAAATVEASLDVVDVILVRYKVNDRTETSPIGTYAHRIEAVAVVICCLPDLKRMLRRIVTEKLEIKINAFIPRALAEAALVLTDDERHLGCMFVDFGAETTTVAIYRQDVPVYVVTLPMGSRNITRDLTALNYLEDRAEEIKKTHGNAMLPDANARKRMAATDSLDATEINNYVHARADEIAANIIAQLEYAGIKETELPAGIIIVGGGSRLRGFNDLLASKIQLKVRQGVINASVHITDGAINPNDSLDVIATLVAASELPDAECLSPLPARVAGNYEDMYGDDDPAAADDRGSRIGRYDDDDDIDNNYDVRGGNDVKSPRGSKPARDDFEGPEPRTSTPKAKPNWKLKLDKAKDLISKAFLEDPLIDKDDDNPSDSSLR